MTKQGELRLAWLRDGPENEEDVFAVRNCTELATDDWDARVEFYTINDGLRVICTKATIHRDMEIDVSTTNEMIGPWTSFNIVDVGSMDVVTSDNVDVQLRENWMSFLTIRDWTAVYKFPGPSKLRHVSASINAEGIREFFDDDVPAELEPLISDADESAVYHFNMPTNVRRVGQGLLDSPLRGRLREIEVEAGIALILAYVGHYFGQSVIAQVGEASPDLERIREARDVMMANIAAPPRLKDLAAGVGMSPKKLNEGFRRVYNMTAFEMLRTERLNQAKILLEQEDIPLKQISYRVGYNHVTNFINAFTRQFGKPPRQYQKTSTQIDLGDGA